MGKGLEIKEKDPDKRYMEDTVMYFYEQKNGFESHKKNFENIKSEFESDMELLYDRYADKEKDEIRVMTQDRYIGLTGIKVKKVQPTSVEINYQKFKNACKDDEIRRKCTSSTYEVKNVNGLLSYLKEQGIRYKDVKQFLKRVHTVDTETVENLVELGELSEDVVKESTLVRFKKPYYKLTPMKPTGGKLRAVEV